MTQPPRSALLTDPPPLDVDTSVLKRAAASKVAGVLVRGRWIDRKAIDETMGELAAATAR